MPDALDGSIVDFRALFDASPTPFLVVRPPDWVIVAANDSRLEITGTTRAEQVGRRLFDVFPDDPDDPEADGVRNLTASLQRGSQRTWPMSWPFNATRFVDRKELS